MRALDLIKILESKNISVKSIFTLLKKRNLIFLLPIVLKILILRDKKEKSFNKVILESAYEFSRDNLFSLEKKIDSKVDEQVINKNLVTGFKVYMKNKIFDATLDTLLKQILKK